MAQEQSVLRPTAPGSRPGQVPSVVEGRRPDRADDGEGAADRGPPQDSVASGPPEPAAPPPLWRRAFDHLEEVVTALALVVILLAVGWGLATRFLLGETAPWTGEVVAIGFAWLIFMGASACFRREFHIVIDALIKLLPQQLLRPLASLVDLLVVALCAYVCWLAIGFAVSSHAASTAVLGWPQSVTYAAPAAAFAFMTLRVAQHAWRRAQAA